MDEVEVKEKTEKRNTMKGWKLHGTAIDLWFGEGVKKKKRKEMEATEENAQYREERNYVVKLSLTIFNEPIRKLSCIGNGFSWFSCL